MASKLTDIKGIGDATAKRLRDAGVKTVHDLRAIDVADVAAKTGLKAETLRAWRDEAARVLEGGVESAARTAEQAGRSASTVRLDLSDIRGLGEASAKKLREAGVRTVEDLRHVDVEDLAKRTGIKASSLEGWRNEAARLLERSVDLAARATVAGARRAEEAAVVLKDRATTAKVRLEGVMHENFPIITAKLEESQAEIAKTIEENAVLLKEQADTAWVRVEGEWHKNVPIFKEKLAEGEKAAKGAVEEVRVFVKEIREHPQEALKPGKLLDRLLGKRN
ncbi:MAG TPA: helix-hairpin-helix domain-containing protein [Candidatus Thermoplasmatota archaeon]|jgi:nucleotidyltransferase/DNA polymerase involved in DNA repair|nr:helix-hairpin-helix domain-containing protein [Candidatus Thermoplasmatota archaeon]